MKENLLSVTEVSRTLFEKYGLWVAPHALSNLIYRRVFTEDAIQMIGGRKMISTDYLSTLVAILRERGVAKRSEPTPE